MSSIGHDYTVQTVRVFKVYGISGTYIKSLIDPKRWWTVPDREYEKLTAAGLSPEEILDMFVPSEEESSGDSE